MPALDLNLAGLAETVTEDGGAAGAVVIRCSEDRVDFGSFGLTAEEVRRALCAAIHGTFLVEEE